MPETSGNRIHKCDVCGKQGAWGPDWSWRWRNVARGGAMADHISDPDMIIVCSEECKSKVSE